METKRFTDTSDEPQWVRDLKAHDEDSPQKTYGVVAEYETPGELMDAARKVRDAGYTKWDTLSPFPIHGIEDSMGIKPTILPWFTLALGITGAVTGVWLQWFSNAYAYEFMISGKPLWSLPANIPVAYELTILFAAFTTFFAMFGLNLLPEWFHPLFRHPRMKRYTSDRFAVVIEAKDPMFDAERARAILSEAGGTQVETLMGPAQRAPLPKVFFGTGVVVTMLALVPPAWIVKSRFAKDDRPRIHPIQDMDFQAKFKTQAPNPVLAQLWGDPRASLPAPAGTVARGEFVADPSTHSGIVSGEGEDAVYLADFPEDVTVDQALLERGAERFAIYCAPCHGQFGAGDGLIAKRATSLAEAQSASGRSTGMAWVAPVNLADQRILDQPIGQIFHTITNGLNNMKGYASQIARDDRWAIAAHVRALQISQTATVDGLSAEERAELE